MKKITKTTLLVTCLLVLCGQASADDFTAFGTEPFWHITLTPLGGENYQAKLAYPGEESTVNVTATVIKQIHQNTVTYNGKTAKGKPFSVTTIKTNCEDDSKGDTWSHVVMAEQFQGCGGKVIASEDEGSSSQQQASSNSAREQAKKLNTQGFRLYKKGNYYRALPYFHRATQADRNYVLGQYNLACAATIVLNNFDCNQDEQLLAIANPDNIFAALKQAIALDPKRKAKSLTDPDLAMLRKSYRYWRDIWHYSPDNDSQLQKMLENIEWTQAAGFYQHHGQPARLVFNNGYVESIDNKGLHRAGSYTVNHGVITLVIDAGNRGTLQVTGRLLDNDGVFDGVLHFAGASKANILPIDDYNFAFPTPCEGN